MEHDGLDFSFKKYFIPFTTNKAIHYIIIIGLLVFINSLFNGFVGDDIGQLVDNALVHNIQNIPQFFFGGTFNNGNGAIIGLYYKPLLLTSYALVYSLFGSNSFVYHFLQLILHISNGILVFLLFTKFFKKELAFALSLVFLVHPINADTVDYIANLQDVLFTFFGLLALNMVIFKNKNRITLFLTGLYFFLSMLSKETGIAFAVIIVCYMFLFDKTNSKRYSLLIISLTLLYITIHLAIIGNGFSQSQPFPIMRASFPVRLFTIPAIIAYYVTTFFFPVYLTLDHQWVVEYPTIAQFYVPLIIDGIFFGLIVFLYFLIKNNRKEYKIFFFFCVWFISGLVLHLQIIPLDYTVANRWFYFPIIGLLGICGVLFTALYPKKLLAKNILLLLVFLLIAVFSVRTIIRNSNWYSGMSLATHDLQYSPEDYSLENYLGVLYYNLGNYKLAEKHFQRSIQIAPYWDLNRNYLGEVYERVGESKGNKQLISKAKQTYLISIKNSINDETPYDNLAHLLVFTADKNAYSFLVDSLKKFPHSSELWYYLAIYELSNHHRQEALIDAKNAYINNPSNQDAVSLYSGLLNGSTINLQIN